MPDDPGPLSQRPREIYLNDYLYHSFPLFGCLSPLSNSTRDFASLSLRAIASEAQKHVPYYLYLGRRLRTVIDSDYGPISGEETDYIL